MNVRFFRALARDWEAYGHHDPFFGVLSDPSKRGGRWDPDAFLASGRQHVANLMVSLRDSGITVSAGRALDFGCGLGRLTQPLAEYFDHVVGVDVAGSMIRRARRLNRHGDRCTYVLNRAPDLARFDDGAFEFVHSCIVLQHLPPELASTYIREFFRVCRPGGLVVFQVPSALRAREASGGAFALSDRDYSARIELARPLPIFHTGALTTVALTVRNTGHAAWRHDVPTDEAGHIRVGNHWRSSDGTVLVRDDGRAALSKTVIPGERIDVDLVVRAPPHAGAYLLELDLVQELVCWFGEKGSPTMSVPVAVHGAEVSSLASPAVPARATPVATPASTTTLRWSFGDRIAEWLGRLRRVKPEFPMHPIPRPEVERLVTDSGGTVVRVFEDDACGDGWVSYTYACRRNGRATDPVGR